MKKRLLSLILTVSVLSSCANQTPYYENFDYTFNTVTSYKYRSEVNLDDDISSILKSLSNKFDTFEETIVPNAAKLNKYREIPYDKDLANIIQYSEEMRLKTHGLFNISVKNLTTLWKDSLAKNIIPDQASIDILLEEIKNTSYVIDDKTIKIEGNGSIDLGAIAKGYSLEALNNFMLEHQVKDYLVDSGSSSIIFGEKNTSDGFYKVKLRYDPSHSLKVKKIALGASAIYEQYKEIDGVKYSHIVNPLTGSATSLHDFVVLLGDNAKDLDALSTVLMMSNIEEIKNLEKEFNFKSIVYDNKKIIYINPEITLYDE